MSLEPLIEKDRYNAGAGIEFVVDNLDSEKIATIWDNKITEEANLMDSITGSNSAMDDHTDVNFIMDTITDKEVAMDKVTDKEVAMDKVTDKEMPMDKVTDKEMPMDKIVTKSISLSKFMLSNFIDKAWDKEIASEAIWSNTDGDFETDKFSLEKDQRNGFNGFGLFMDPGEEPLEGGIEWELDFTNINNLIIWERTDGARSETNQLFEVILDGDTLLSTSDNNNDFEEKDLDVSSYSGVLTLRFQIGQDELDSGDNTIVSDWRVE